VPGDEGRARPIILLEPRDQDRALDDAARQAVDLATLRYEGGVDNYLNLLDAQREQLTAELLESQLVRLQRVSVVQLYKALGGGWDPVTDTLALPLPDTLALQQEQ
jgi:multidrug efflux system outer membrane protein